MYFFAFVMGWMISFLLQDGCFQFVLGWIYFSFACMNVSSCGII